MNRGESLDGYDLRLDATVYAWWDNLTEEEQFNLMLDWYPEEITKDTDIDKFFGDMDWHTQLWIYQRENKCTAEDLEAQKENAGCDEAHRRMVEEPDHDLVYHDRKCEGE